jgi:amidase
MLLLRAATASRMRDEDFARQQEIAATLTDDDMSDRAAVARGATLLHRAWGNANESRRLPLSRTTTTPIVTSAPSWSTAPYAEQLFFAGLASLSYLPATAAPIGLTDDGLPVGLQIIGPEGEDTTTIEFARLLAAEIGGLCVAISV